MNLCCLPPLIVDKENLTYHIFIVLCSFPLHSRNMHLGFTHFKNDCWDWKEISWHWSQILIFYVQFLHFSALKTNSAVITLLSLGEATSMVGLGRSPALLLSPFSHMIDVNFLLVYCSFSLLSSYSTFKHTLYF